MTYDFSQDPIAAIYVLKGDRNDPQTRDMWGQITVCVGAEDLPPALTCVSASGDSMRVVEAVRYEADKLNLYDGLNGFNITFTGKGADGSDVSEYVHGTDVMGLLGGRCGAVNTKDLRALASAVVAQKQQQGQEEEPATVLTTDGRAAASNHTPQGHVIS